MKAILLDIDGTMLESNDAHATAWSQACAEFAMELPASFFRPLIGMGGDKILAKLGGDLSEQTEPGKSIAHRRKEIFLERYVARLKPTPGARALVERLRADQLSPVVASSAKNEELKALLEAAQIADLIDDAATSDDADRSKPDPDIVESALEKARVSNSEALMIGDTPYDIEAAAKAGVRIIAVCCGGWSDRELAGAAAIYDDPQDLMRRYDDSPLAKR